MYLSTCWSVLLYINLFSFLAIFLPFYLFICQFINLHVHIYIYLNGNRSLIWDDHLSVYLSIFILIYLFIYIPIYLINLSYQSIHQTIYLVIYLFVHLFSAARSSIYPSAYLPLSLHPFMLLMFIWVLSSWFYLIGKNTYSYISLFGSKSNWMLIFGLLIHWLRSSIILLQIK